MGNKLSTAIISIWVVGVFGVTFAAHAAVKIEFHQAIAHYQFDEKDYLNPRAKKDLQSGISNQLVVLARIIEMPSKIVAEQTYPLDIRYDLWDEKYYVENKGGEGFQKKVFSQLNDLVKFVESTGPFEWKTTDLLKNGPTYQIHAIETLNPVNKEKMEAVKQWITQQRIANRGASPNSETAAYLAAPENSITALFHLLWKRAVSGEVLTGEIRREDSSDNFTLQQLKGAKQ